MLHIQMMKDLLDKYSTIDRNNTLPDVLDEDATPKDEKVIISNEGYAMLEALDKLTMAIDALRLRLQ